MQKNHLQRQKLSLTNLYFNRFLLIRYATAFFLFLMLYWSVFLVSTFSVVAMLPVTLFVLSALVALEQVKLYRNHSNQLPYARYFYWTSFISCLILLGCVYTSFYSVFFPFLVSTQSVKNLVAILVMVSLILSILVLIKLHNIKLDRDKHFSRVKAYEKIIN